ncbi:MAG: efflux RND transporter periplasmic adaptor subunit [Paracoccus sp. (in: a-proteobacteria)]
MLRIFFLVLMIASGPAIAADESPDHGENEAAQAVSVVAASMMPIEVRIPVSGSLVARQEALVYPRVSGFEVTEILAEVGDDVMRGQVLARLSDETLKAQLAQAQAEAQRASAAVGQAQSQIDSAEATLAHTVSALDRARQLQRGGSATQAALDQAVADEAATRATLASARDGLAVAHAARATADAAADIARLNLERIDIVAPVDGVVTARSAQIGALGGTGGEPMFTIVSQGEVEWQADVVETALGQLNVDDPAIVAVAGMGEISGRVRLLPASVDPATRLGTLRIVLDSDKPLTTGLFASGWVIADRHEGVGVPLTAILSGPDGDVVQVVDAGGVIETRKVLAGAIWQGQREILSGVTEGETVISRAGAFFRDGDQISPVSDEAVE